MKRGSSNPEPSAAFHDGARKTLLHVFPSFAVGGQQTRFATVAAALERPLRHVIVSLDGRDAAMGLLPASVDAVLRPVEPGRRVGRPGTGRGWSAGGLAAAARTIAAVAPDALVTCNWGAMDWAIANRLRLGSGLPHLHLEDGFGPEEADTQIRRRVLTRRAVLRRAEVIVPSRTLATIAARSWRLPADRIHCIPNGIDASRFDAAPTRNTLFERGDADCIIGTCAPLRREKNLGRLLHAFACLDGRARLVICGDGPEAAALKGLAQSLGVAERVVFTGHVRAPELVMRSFDLFAITSDTEQMPYAVLEAMCAGLPIVGTDVGDIAAMVHPDNRRFVVPKQRPDLLVAALTALRGDAELRRWLGEANRAEVRRRFTIEQMTRAFAAIMDRALLPGSRPSPPCACPVAASSDLA